MFPNDGGDSPGKKTTEELDNASRFGKSNPGYSTKKWDHYGNEIHLYGPTKKASELQRKYQIELNIYDFKGARDPCYEMSDQARFRILDTPVTLKDLKRSEQLFMHEPSFMDKFITLNATNRQSIKDSQDFFKYVQSSKNAKFVKNGRAYMSPERTPESVFKLNTFRRSALGFMAHNRYNSVVAK